MEFIFVFIGELLAELALQGAVELVASLLKTFFGAVRDEFRPAAKPLHPAVRWLIYLVVGMVAGAVSGWIFPHHFISDGVARRLSVVVTPVLLGLGFVALGRWRKRRGRKPSDFDQFGCGASFAAGMAIVRAIWLT